ncbi:Piso0_003622 [Millerozyma farinosa CBS 7064]|uniref:Piso0_003622 protein n=1 Tax=Pichia sorbitophila (strain ATCC MYA-4447 / BCRC 22081 / CBS 7064 / NBRC 10061 / NRRL Y-12695) TaxID=559304 RepID=G8YGF3_PICSO|nr:Piso0_003622 [Millerozyma farinosa CBS 7064]CCE81270.1 Piso0_003622 [Millerozyma farinosa CBS 7064]
MAIFNLTSPMKKDDTYVDWAGNWRKPSMRYPDTNPYFRRSFCDLQILYLTRPKAGERFSEILLEDYMEKKKGTYNDSITVAPF